jgi:hypothetical protein
MELVISPITRPCLLLCILISVYPLYKTQPCTQRIIWAIPIFVWIVILIMYTHTNTPLQLLRLWLMWCATVNGFYYMVHIANRSALTPWPTPVWLIQCSLGVGHVLRYWMFFQQPCSDTTPVVLVIYFDWSMVLGVCILYIAWWWWYDVNAVATLVLHRRMCLLHVAFFVTMVTFVTMDVAILLGVSKPLTVLVAYLYSIFHVACVAFVYLSTMTYIRTNQYGMYNNAILV